MVKHLIYILVVGTILISSCDNDLDLISDKKDIPVVYGLLTPFDTAQYFRIERAFIDPSTSALEIAQRPDSLYYPNITVKLTSGNNEYLFSRVDGNLEGYPREDGAFATAPNILYKALTSDLNLVQGELYNLEINRGDDLTLVTASTSLVEAPRISRPSSSSRIDFDYVDLTKITWRAAQGGQIFDVRLYINMIERNQDPNIADKEVALTWPAGRNIEGEEFGINGKAFYQYLQNNLVEDVNISRIFRNVEVEVIAGGAEILEYIKVGQANLGITSSQDIPTYTNLSEGFGLFSSKGKAIVEGVQVSSGTLDSLRDGVFTKALNFR